MTRGLCSADPRVDLAYRFAFFKLTAAYRRVLVVAGAPRAGPADPTRGPENRTKLATSRTKASLSYRYSDRMLSKRPGQSYQMVTLFVPDIKYKY